MAITLENEEEIALLAKVLKEALTAFPVHSKAAMLASSLLTYLEAE
jgi:hypothetical protein